MSKKNRKKVRKDVKETIKPRKNKMIIAISFVVITIILAVAGLFVHFKKVEKKFEPQKIVMTNRPDQVFLSMVNNHPDKDISVNLYQAVISKHLMLGPMKPKDAEPRKYGGALFLFYVFTDQSLQRWNTEIPRTGQKYYPIFLINVSMMYQNLQSKAGRISFLSALSHEYEHYKQFLHSSESQYDIFFFDNNKETSQECELHWVFEKEAFQKQCEVLNSWGYPGFGPRKLCYQRNSIDFLREFRLLMLYGYAEAMPECIPIWKAAR
jgi:hypothetical protein